VDREGDGIDDCFVPDIFLNNRIESFVDAFNDGAIFSAMFRGIGTQIEISMGRGLNQ